MICPAQRHLAAQALEIKEPSIDFEAVLAEVRAHDAATPSRDFRARRAVRMARPSGALGLKAA